MLSHNNTACVTARSVRHDRKFAGGVRVQKFRIGRLSDGRSARAQHVGEDRRAGRSVQGTRARRGRRDSDQRAAGTFPGNSV